jgi:hypothetical protein
MKKIYRLLTLLMLIILMNCRRSEGQEIAIWSRFEKAFTSSKDYGNALYDTELTIEFTSPTGRTSKITGFWDGARTWKVRFMPDEEGLWKWTSDCRDKSNTGLNGLSGTFTCTKNRSPLAIFQKGNIKRSPGMYHLEYADGTPFFWTACTAWNGPLKSTDEEWDYYLTDRATNHYNVIQFVTTQWRGCDKNSLGQVAFDGSGLIRIHPEFFQHLDEKIDMVNNHGLVAAPVLLWALSSRTGRDLSPGYYLPEEECILLARYMVARYGGNHVVWILGGDGKYTTENPQRWKNIGRGVFGEQRPGLVAMHPSGKEWIGDIFGAEEWLDIIGYQTGHDNSPRTVTWITEGPVASSWSKVPAKPFINMEPVYEEINPTITPADIRNASYWSLLSTPTSGISYGANGVWPWLREGEVILNHAGKGEQASRWREGIELPGSVQVGYLSAFMQGIEWWKLKPAPALLIHRSAVNDPKNFISLSQTDDRKLIVAYLPFGQEITLSNSERNTYEGEWFNPETNKINKAKIGYHEGVMTISGSDDNTDRVLVLKKIK